METKPDNKSNKDNLSPPVSRSASVDPVSSVEDIKNDNRVEIDKIFSESKGVGYYRRYGLQFAFSIIILFIFFCLVTYFKLQEKFSYYRNAQKLVYNEKDDEYTSEPIWNTVKCEPHILPISGYIKKKPNETASTATLRYMNECIKFDAGSLTILNPINAASATISVTMNTFTSVLASLRSNVEDVLFSLIRNAKKVNRTTALHRYNIVEEIQINIDKKINDSVIELGNSTINLEKRIKNKKKQEAARKVREKQEEERRKRITGTQGSNYKRDTTLIEDIETDIHNFFNRP